MGEALERPVLVGSFVLFTGVADFVHRLEIFEVRYVHKRLLKRHAPRIVVDVNVFVSETTPLRCVCRKTPT